MLSWLNWLVILSQSIGDGGAMSRSSISLIALRKRSPLSGRAFTKRLQGQCRTVSRQIWFFITYCWAFVDVCSVPVSTDFLSFYCNQLWTLLSSSSEKTIGLIKLVSSCQVISHLTTTNNVILPLPLSVLKQILEKSIRRLWWERWDCFFPEHGAPSRSKALVCATTSIL